MYSEIFSWLEDIVGSLKFQFARSAFQSNPFVRLIKNAPEEEKRKSIWIVNRTSIVKTFDCSVMRLLDPYHRDCDWLKKDVLNKFRLNQFESTGLHIIFYEIGFLVSNEETSLRFWLLHPFHQAFSDFYTDSRGGRTWTTFHTKLSQCYGTIQSEFEAGCLYAIEYDHADNKFNSRKLLNFLSKK